MYSHVTTLSFYKLAISQKKLVKLMLVKINVLTCDYIDFYKLAISQDKKTCETDAGQKSMYSHVSTLRQYCEEEM